MLPRVPSPAPPSTLALPPSLGIGREKFSRDRLVSLERFAGKIDGRDAERTGGSRFMNGPFWNIRRKQRENRGTELEEREYPPLPLFFHPEFRRNKSCRSGVFNGIESSSDHLPRRTFIPGTLLKSRVSGTVSMVHDTWRELNRSRGRVITSRLERRRRKKKGAVCREIKKRREGKMERKRGVLFDPPDASGLNDSKPRTQATNAMFNLIYPRYYAR